MLRRPSQHQGRGVLPGAPPQATLAEAEAADGERKSLGEQLAAAKKAAAELTEQVGDAASRKAAAPGC